MLWLVSLLIELSIGQVNHSLPLYAFVSRLVPLHAPSTTACSHLFTLINVVSIYACAHAHIHQLVHIIISNIVTSPSLSGKTVLDLFTFILQTDCFPIASFMMNDLYLYLLSQVWMIAVITEQDH